MHVDRAERLTRPREDLGELLDVLGRFRWHLARQQLLRFGLRGLILSCGLLTCLSAADWLIDSNAFLTTLSGVALAAGPITAILVALIRWPSARRAALAADHHLGLAERLTTALELTSRPASGRFDALQIRDAISSARNTKADTWPSALHTARGEARLAAVALALALASLLVPLLPRPSLPTATPDAMITDSAAPEGERVVPPEVLEASVPEPQAAPQATAEADLEPRVQQALAEHEALERLADALSQVSAGRAAADAIERGDFSGARDQLATLGEEADQLSDAAKKQLSQALQSAAAATTGDRALADRERQAAQALGRSNYSEQRQALRQLGEQIERSGARSLSQSQLARDSGRLQQQQQQQQQANSGGTQSPGSRAQSQASGQAGAAQPQPGAGQQAKDAAASGVGDQAGEQSGLGSGTGTTEPFGGANDPLDRVGEQVEVPTKLGAGPGQRPPDGSEDQVGANPGVGVRSVAEATQTQQTGQVAPEQNLVPGEQRPVVRGYFR